MEGYGTMTYSIPEGHSEIKPNERPHYTGYWKDGKPEGQGTMVSAVVKKESYSN